MYDFILDLTSRSIGWTLIGSACSLFLIGQFAYMLLPTVMTGPKPARSKTLFRWRTLTLVYPRNFARSTVIGLIAVIWAIFAGALVLAFAYVLYLIVQRIPPSTDPEATGLRMLLITMTALTASLGATIALPFTVLRTQYNKRQTDAAEAGLVNNKLDAAFAGLSARRKVTSRTREVVYKRFGSSNAQITVNETPDTPFELPKGAVEIKRGPWQVISEEEDDIVTRSTAIDRLEGLAVEQPEQVARIVSILSLYVRELSREYPAKEIPEGIIDPKEIRKWAGALKPIRPDMEKAAQTLGRLPKLVDGYDPEKIKPDLRSCNLQGFDLKGFCFKSSEMEQAWLQGADLTDAKIQRANLWYAKMQGADLTDAEMQEANLPSAEMQGAVLMYAKMQRAVLTFAKMQGANIRYAEMQGADLTDAEMQRADLTLAKMQGVDLTNAEMQEADLTVANLRGAAVRSADFTDVAVSDEQWKDMLGDDTTTLPDYTPYPNHWPKFEMDWEEFELEWERFKEDLDAYTPA